ncbi:gsl0967 [Gloeobacter violaceus PCC 7421]|uniref:Gsl0967 protein n=1 Tax=Gloeobacter violaceus (strain ATCC 29082 / PCC 7421) TaxID=251221 RepID=Q7NM02_GLOVI|nr:gsl0967 [Gloeobacter violaceus PCC 7421]
MPPKAGECTNRPPAAVHKVEHQRLRSGCFRLPSRQATQANVHPEVVVVDVNKVPIEQPKKSKDCFGCRPVPIAIGVAASVCA